MPAQCERGHIREAQCGEMMRVRPPLRRRSQARRSHADTLADQFDHLSVHGFPSMRCTRAEAWLMGATVASARGCSRRYPPPPRSFAPSCAGRPRARVRRGASPPGCATGRGSAIGLRAGEGGCSGRRLEGQDLLFCTGVPEDDGTQLAVAPVIEAGDLLLVEDGLAEECVGRARHGVRPRSARC